MFAIQFSCSRSLKCPLHSDTCTENWSSCKALSFFISHAIQHRCYASTLLVLENRYALGSFHGNDSILIWWSHSYIIDSCFFILSMFLEQRTINGSKWRKQILMNFCIVILILFLSCVTCSMSCTNRIFNSLSYIIKWFAHEQPHSFVPWKHMCL